MEKVEIPYDYKGLKDVGLSFGIGAIFLLAIFIDYYITYKQIGISEVIVALLLLGILICGYLAIQSFNAILKKAPALIFEKDKITSGSIVGKYSISIEIFQGYRLAEYNGRYYINIYPKDYKKFKKQLGFSIFRRLVFFSVKKSGFEGLMISTYTMKENYEAAIRFLEEVFN